MSFPERKRQFAEPPLHPIRLDIREVLAVHPWCALVIPTVISFDSFSGGFQALADVIP